MDKAANHFASADWIDTQPQQPQQPQQPPLALYVHWPFCISKCPYCDFNSHVRSSVDQDAWREALLADLAYEADTEAGARLGSIFFGGGTPSLIPPSTVAAIIEAAERHWGFEPGIEITLEANPSSVESSRFADLARAGVNRVSLGLQSLDDKALRFLGRAHGSNDGLAALEVAQREFERVSFDLIYALPGQSEQDWANELAKALSFGAGHMSLYQLTIEPGTRFAALAAKGELKPADPDHAALLYEITQALAGDAGVPAYEISNHARPGEESRHNLAYWRYHSYIGIGPGAHGRRSKIVTQRHKKPENWLKALQRNGHGISEENVLTPRDRAIEAVLMGLRLREGIDLHRISLLADRPWQSVLNPAAIQRLQDEAFVDQKDSHLAVTARGVLLLNAILAEIVVA